MNKIIATITGISFIIAERNDLGSASRTLAAEVRPTTFAEADDALAFYSLRRTCAWELDTDGSVSATVGEMDNRFNGTVAARLDRAVGITHDDFEIMSACQARDGDLISDIALEGCAVVAGSRQEGDTTRVHMVSEGKTWSERYTTNFPSHQLVQVACRKG